MGKKKKKINKEEIAEDYCFDCKDGGLLRVCDYKDCLKAYHPQCLGKDDSFLESEVSWSCRWHSCLLCSNNPKFQCFCCPKAVCGRCLCDTKFVILSAKKGLCNHCLTLVVLIERIKDPDANEGKIDFDDRNTYEFMFKGYWEMIKRKGGVTLERVHSAYKLMNKGRNYGYDSDLNDIYESEEDNDFSDENQLMADYDDSNNEKGHIPMRNRKRIKGKSHVIKEKVKSKNKEFVGWASKPLFVFLASIGKDTTQELSQYDVSAIITRYCQEHQLFHPENKRKILCDAKLQLLLGRKSVNKNSIYKFLTAHFAGNFQQSEDEIEYSSEDEGGNVLMFCERQQNSSSGIKSQSKEVIPDVRRSCFASIISKNIKLVYLKRSVLEELSKRPETFDAKVMGSFVRIKSDPFDYLQKNSHQLVQVTGIKQTLGNGKMTSGSDILLQVSNMPKDIPICKLSDDDFSEKECEDLRQRVKDGWLKRPTVKEFEEKARSLHDVITKHWIVRELALLQNHIDRANEKGWRRELSEYMDRMLLLQTQTEQSRLLHEVPEIIADEVENDLSRKDEQKPNPSTESAHEGTLKNPRKSSKGHGISCRLNDGADAAGNRDSVGEKPACGRIGSRSGSKDDQSRKDTIVNMEKDAKEEQRSEWSVREEHQQSHTIACESSKDDILRMEKHGSFQKVMAYHPKESHPAPFLGQSLGSVPQGQSNAFLSENQYQPVNVVESDKPADVEHETMKTMKTTRSVPEVEFIELSDDDEPEANTAVSEQTTENLNSSIWHIVSPHGIRKGPYSMEVLKQWSDISSYELKFKVWKTGQTPEEAISLTDAIRQFFAWK